MDCTRPPAGQGFADADWLTISEVCDVVGLEHRFVRKARRMVRTRRKARGERYYLYSGEAARRWRDEIVEPWRARIELFVASKRGMASSPAIRIAQLAEIRAWCPEIPTAALTFALELLTRSAAEAGAA